ncbi:MAG: sigma-54-dependent Fis family transcriptional regulator [Planctomycetes bacterium]|nr:sigma-54-dependent Fis family transcriptional regulator [Planctomycetota bacterium]
MLRILTKEQDNDRMNKKPNILFTDDEDTFRNIMSKELSRMGYNVTCCSSGQETIKKLNERDYDVAILDMNMPVMDGIETLKKVKAIEPTTEVIILTGQGSIENAVQAIKSGAYDYLTKPCQLKELDLLLQRALEKRKLNRENSHLKALVRDVQKPSLMIGNSPAIKSVFKMIDKTAPSDAIVLIQGESGAGKELVAKMIHQYSKRADKPFVIVNCATLQETLLESELFGHVKGSFTGATESRVGLFEIAEGGTLFLDEIGELTVNTQAKLLRVLQSGEIRRVGDNRVITVDTRIIAATHKNLPLEVKEGRFREDLYFRLNVITLHLPPLRERKEDITDLIHHFLQKFCKAGQTLEIQPEALRAMMLYDWPGNIRELENTIERSVVLADGNSLAIDDLPDNILGRTYDPHSKKGDAALSEVEKNHITRVLNEKKWNKPLAAKTLGISLKTLYNKMKIYDIDL